MTAPFPDRAELPASPHQHHTTPLNARIHATACGYTAATLSTGNHLPPCPTCDTRLAHHCGNTTPHPRHRVGPADNAICPGAPR